LPVQDFASRLVLRAVRMDMLRGEIERLCAHAKALRAGAVCVNGSRVALARSLLEETDIKVCAAIAFPFGAMASDVKRYEIEAALDDGAHEFELVLNHGWIKEGEDKLLTRELRDVAEAADERPVVAILEPGRLSPEEMVRAALLVAKAELPCLGLATGFGPRAATADEVKLLVSVADGKLAVQANLAQNDRPTGAALLAAGAFRLGVPGEGSL